MKRKLFSPSKFIALAVAITAFALPAMNSWATSTEQILHAFNGNDGANPYAGVISDSAGNLYGTTLEGGNFQSDGVVFKLTRSADGKWKETILHIFRDSPDGAHPDAGLISDGAGNLYGTTGFGGANKVGTIFKVERRANGQWKETVLYSFVPNGKDGTYPSAGLVMDGAGNLYGTTIFGGSSQACPYNPLSPPGCGTVFELSPGTHGKWSEKILHSFGNGSKGANPAGSLIFDHSENLYGTTITGGGAKGDGTVFKLVRGANGQWTETVLHQFGGQDGIAPYCGLIFDHAGSLYGTTATGGTSGNGTVFKLARGANGKWVETVLYPFGNGNDGATPYAGVILDHSGHLYGSTSGGGNLGDGTVFKLAKGANGQWTETTLYSFNGNDGTGLIGGSLIFDKTGTILYGTAPNGVDLQDCHVGCGAVFEIKP